MSRPTLAFLCAVVTTGIPASAIAAPPQSEQLIDVGLGALAPIDCGTFTLTYEMSGERARVTTFFDQQGNPKRMRIHWTIHGTLIHSLSGETLRDQSTLIITVDPTSDATTVAGVAFHYAVPGKGLIFLEAGRLIIDAGGGIQFSAGPKDGLAGFGQLCEALAT
jgi:hypothetical protein